MTPRKYGDANEDDTEELLEYISMLSTAKSSDALDVEMNTSDISVHHVFNEHAEDDISDDEEIISTLQRDTGECSQFELNAKKVMGTSVANSSSQSHELSGYDFTSTKGRSFLSTTDKKESQEENQLKGPRLRSRLELGQRRIETYLGNKKQSSIPNYQIWFVVATLVCVLPVFSTLYKQNTATLGEFGESMIQLVKLPTSPTLETNYDKGGSLHRKMTISSWGEDERHGAKDRNEMDGIAEVNKSYPLSLVSKVKSASRKLCNFTKKHAPGIVIMINLLSVGYSMKSLTPFVSNLVKKVPPNIQSSLQLLQIKK